jgi:hypothetical protein
VTEILLPPLQEYTPSVADQIIVPEPVVLDVRVILIVIVTVNP